MGMMVGEGGREGERGKVGGKKYWVSVELTRCG